MLVDTNRLVFIDTAAKFLNNACKKFKMKLYWLEVKIFERKFI